jgi:hypothetical protein
MTVDEVRRKIEEGLSASEARRAMSTYRRIREIARRWNLSQRDFDPVVELRRARGPIG